MNGENITISRKAGTLTISSQAEPANPTLTYSNISESWVSRNGNVLTIDANSGANDRSFDITVTATTTANTAYDGTATDSKTFTITQNGTGSTPTGFNVESVFGASQDFGTFTITTNGIVVTVDGISDDPTLIRNVIAGDTLQFVVTNNTSSTVNIGLAYAPASTVPSYTWNYDIAPNGSAGLYVASAVENYKLYIDVNN